MVGILEMRSVLRIDCVALGAVCAGACLFFSGCGAAGASGRAAQEAATVPHERAPVAGADEYDDLALFTEALLLIKRYHVEDRDFTQLVYSDIDGMVEELDPHSSFLAPDLLKSLDESTEGRFVGIGVNVEPDREGVKVLAPLEGSPALKAGIRAGDKITAVNGASLQGVTLNEAVEKIRGEAGSKVEVTVERAGGGTEQVELVRDDIKVSSVLSSRMIDEKTGFLRLRQFTSSTASDVALALNNLVEQGMERLVLDLRDNPGGVLSTSVEVAELFLEEGDLIVTLKSRGGEDGERRYKAGSGYKLPEIPVVVLVNHGSASASEVVAGALRGNRRALLVGERTYGKASVQSVIKMSLRPECAVRLTTGYYFTPDGDLIHGQGLEPDEDAQLNYEQRGAVKSHYLRESVRSGGAAGAEIFRDDPQLDKALEVLNRGVPVEGAK